MMHGRLGHDLEALIKRRIDQSLQLVIKGSDNERVILGNHLLTKLVKLSINNQAFVGKRDLVCVIHLLVKLEELITLLDPCILRFFRSICKSLLLLCIVSTLVEKLSHVG